MKSEDSLAFLIMDLIIVCLLISIWLMVKYIEAVVSAWMINPHFKPLWMATGFAVLMTVIAYLTNFADPLLDGLYSLSHLILYALCKAMEVYYNKYVEQETSKESMVENIKHGPWWEPKRAQ